MRDAFARCITQLADEDERVVLLSGDIGNRLFDQFRARHPKRFYNCGVAEANMTSVAAGLALCGLRPVTYTIAAFNTVRCLEQIKIDLCYHRAPVVVVGTGAGLSYANLGATHFSCEDLAQLRTLPGLTVVCPGDALEVGPALRGCLAEPGPSYLRLGKKGEPRVHAEPPALVIGKALVVRPGERVALLAAGTMLAVARDAADRLGQSGVSAAVVSCHTVRPLDHAFLADAFARYEVVATLEEHGRAGGFGSAVGEWLLEHGGTAHLICFGTDGTYPHHTGSQEFMRQQYGLTAESVSARVAALLRRSPA